MVDRLIGVHDETGMIDSAGLRTVFGRFPSGVTALCALGDDGEPVGMAVSAFVGVSLDPPLVGVCIQKTSTTWPQLGARPRIGLSVMGASQRDECRRLASREGDRFAGLEWNATDEGAILLHRASGWLDCTVESRVPAGDHDLVLLRIHRHLTHPDNSPLVFYASSFHAVEPLSSKGTS